MRSWVLFCHKWTTLSCLSCKSTFQKALAADIAALEADALLGALLLEAAVTEAPAREVLHARLEKLKGVLDPPSACLGMSRSGRRMDLPLKVGPVDSM